MLTVTIPPAVNPVTTAEAKQHARIHASFTADDVYVADLVEAARIKFEREAGYYLSQTQFTWTPDCTAQSLVLPLRPVLDPVEVWDGETELVEDTDFTLYIDERGFGTIEFTVTPSEPRIVFTVGFADPDTEEGEVHAAPADTKLAIKTLVAHWYNNREAFSGKALGPVAGAWESVIRGYRIA